MPRQARLDVPGTLHYVIIRGIEKRRIADNLKNRGHFVSRIGEIASDTGPVILSGHYEDERLSQFSHNVQTPLHEMEHFILQ